MNGALFRSLAWPRRRVERTALLLLALSAFPAMGSEYETAHALVVRKKWSEALPMLEKLNREAPNSSLVAHDYAQALLRMNRRRESMRLLRKFGSNKLAEVAGRTFAHQESYRLYQEGLNFLAEQKLALARDRFEKAYEKDRDQFELMIRIVQVETLDLRPDSASNWITSTREVHGDSPELSLWEGRVLSLRKRYPEAIKKLTQATKDFPESQNAALWLAEAYAAQKDLNEARLLLQSDLKKNPMHLRALAQKIRWDLDALSETESEIGDIEADLKSFQLRLDQAGLGNPPRFESELGVETFQLDQMKDELTLLQSRFEEAKKRPALSGS